MTNNSITAGLPDISMFKDWREYAEYMNTYLREFHAKQESAPIYDELGRVTIIQGGTHAIDTNNLETEAASRFRNAYDSSTNVIPAGFTTYLTIPIQILSGERYDLEVFGCLDVTANCTAYSIVVDTAGNELWPIYGGAGTGYRQRLLASTDPIFNIKIVGQAGGQLDTTLYFQMKCTGLNASLLNFGYSLAIHKAQG